MNAAHICEAPALGKSLLRALLSLGKQRTSRHEGAMSVKPQEILCIGSVLWDIIGRSQLKMQRGSDVPGRIVRIPGGVAMNIAMTLQKVGLEPSLLTALGRDPEGDDLLSYCEQTGIDAKYVHFSDTMPTDTYMAIEGSNGLIAAIADAHSLEAAGDAILTPLYDGTLGSNAEPYAGAIALDGNLTEELLGHIARSPAFSKADLRIAPASPGKARRLKAIMCHPNATLYVNCEEAGYLCDAEFFNAQDAAAALVANGARRAIVTHGADAACDHLEDISHNAAPPKITPKRITGAGDTFMAAHIAAELAGSSRENALKQAQQTAATYVAGETTDV